MGQAPEAWILLVKAVPWRLTGTALYLLISDGEWRGGSRRAARPPGFDVGPRRKHSLEQHGPRIPGRAAKALRSLPPHRPGLQGPQFKADPAGRGAAASLPIRTGAPVAGGVAGPTHAGKSPRAFWRGCSHETPTRSQRPLACLSPASLPAEGVPAAGSEGQTSGSRSRPTASWQATRRWQPSTLHPHQDCHPAVAGRQKAQCAPRPAGPHPR